MIHTILGLLSPANIIASLGFLGVIGIIFAESGLFFGFFLPGDSLLFAAGLFAASSTSVTSGALPIWLFVGCFVAAVAGDSVGFAFGKKAGQALYSRPDSRWFKHKHIEKAHAFYEKHGAKAIILARFMPVVRTFAPIVAGAAQMNYRRFFSYNIIGGFIWSWGMLGLGYFFGRTIPGVAEYITPIIIGIVVVSFLPALIPAGISLVKSWISKRENL